MKTVYQVLAGSAAWRPSHLQLLVRQLVYRNRNAGAGFTDRDHLQAAAAWLARAQDVTRGGGVCGRYLLRGGWISAYPETTGYLIPTFLALDRIAGVSGFRDRARRAVDFLLGLQHANGAFPAGEVHENTTRLSVFNSAQIVAGLLAWHEASGDERALDAAKKAGDWILSRQDSDGAWRRCVYDDVAGTYHAHAACWLAQLGKYLGVERYLNAARAHHDWVLEQVDPDTGWFGPSGFTERHHRDRIASTHTTAYALSGTLLISGILCCRTGHDAVERAAWSLARKLELWGWMPGMLDHEWRRRADYACLTRNAQLACRWTVPGNVRRTIPPVAGNPAFSIRTVLYAGPRSAKVEQMVRAWADWGVRAGIGGRRIGIFGTTDRPPADHDPRSRSSGDRGRDPAAGSAPLAWTRFRACSDAERKPEFVRVLPGGGDPRSASGIAEFRDGREAVEELRPDLAIHAGAGILRDAVLSIPRLGTLNAHMGLLPKYRGVNVTEWAALNEEPIGCSVHFIDPGIDTGPIAVVREVATAGVSAVADLRRIVDQEQIALLGEVVRFVVSTGRRPATRPQRPEEGRQYFRMHRELRTILQAKLTERARARLLTVARPGKTTDR